MSKLNSKVADTAPVRPVAGTETLEPVIPFFEDLVFKFKPLKVTNILNYEVSVMTNSIEKSTYKSRTCSIAEILQLISTGHSISSEEYPNQLIFVNFPVKYKDSILRIAEDNNLYPTFIINSGKYNYDNGIYTNENLTFCYCLEKSIIDYVKYSFEQHLKTVFHSYWDDFNTYGYSGTGLLLGFTNITISNNIYIPVEGGIAHE